MPRGKSHSAARKLVTPRLTNISLHQPMPEFSDCPVPELHWWPSAHSRVEATGIGRVGVLCGHEHADPVFKRRTIQKREDLHISTWAPLFKNDPQTKAPWFQTTEGMLEPGLNR